MVRITSVDKRSKGDKAGLAAGDGLISINGNEINDVLDYRYYLCEEKLTIQFLRDGKERTAKIKKDEYDDIGLNFETPLMDKKHSCKNKCVFCFIDQNPDGLRDTLYFKDDDSRLSFIHGNYITLTNLTDKDVDRIIKMRFSPINISVHTTNPELRVKMMKNKNAGDSLRYLSRFREAGLSMCGQIVLCKGLNDGNELLRTMTDLAEYYPEMSSVAIVPAGLTKYRDKLYLISDFTKEEAASVIDMIDAFAAEHKKETGSRLFFAADEFYLKAEMKLPETDYYEDYPQIENGVGLIRSLTDEFEDGISDIENLAENLCGIRRVAVATGVASYPTILNLANRINSMTDKVNVEVYEIKNKFFGESITVSGLLTGKDIEEQLRGKINADILLIPSCAVRREEKDFLCGMSVSELQKLLGVKIRLTENNGYDFLNAVFGAEGNDF